MRLRALVSALLLIAPPALAYPSFRFEESSVIVQGLAPGGSAALVGISRQRVEFLDREDWFGELLVDQDGDGEVRLDLDLPLVARSVWGVVEVETGDFELGVPPGGTLNNPEFSLQSLNAETGEIVQEGRYLTVLLVRPAPAGAPESSGVWLGEFADAGATEPESVPDNQIVARIGLLDSLTGAEAPPKSFVDGDVLVWIDAESLFVSAVRLSLAGSE